MSKEFEVKLKAQIDETKRIGNKTLAHKIDLRHKELQTEVALGVSKNWMVSSQFVEKLLNSRYDAHEKSMLIELNLKLKENELMIDDLK